jgi:hypothetical protein
MYNVTSWEAQTKDLLNFVEQKIKEIQLENEQRLANWIRKKEALEEVLKTYNEVKGINTKPNKILTAEAFQGKSQREILRLIARNNNDLLVAKEAIELMKSKGIFGNPKNAASIIYSVLSRSPEFEKVGQGVYKLRNGIGVFSNEEKKGRMTSGIKDVVKNLKESNPNMTKNEALDQLLKDNFNFMGKNPKLSVHMAWVALGYSKQNQQTSQIPMINMKEGITV